MQIAIIGLGKLVKRLLRGNDEIIAHDGDAKLGGRAVENPDSLAL